MNKTALRKLLKKLESGASTLNETMKEIHKLENPNNTGSMFSIDFFEFSFLVEACIPPRPIARSMFWQDVIDKHYHTLSENERSRLFEWISKNPFYQDSLENNVDDARLFQARFDPENQYVVTTNQNDEILETECFKLGDHYWTGKNRFVSEEFIVKVEKKI